MHAEQKIDSLFEKKEKEILKEVEATVKKEMMLFEFELLYAAMIPPEERKKSADWVAEKRKKDWAKALEAAGGDEQKAATIFFA